VGLGPLAATKPALLSGLTSGTARLAVVPTTLVDNRDNRPPGCGRGARHYTERSSESLGRSHALSASIPRRAAGAASGFGSRGPAGAALKRRGGGGRGGCI